MDDSELIEDTIRQLHDRLVTDPITIGQDDNYFTALARIASEIQAYTRILRSVQRRIAACRTRRNTHAPINKLPQDIMHIIFGLTVDEWRTSSSYYVKLFTLRLVCKAWNSFICDTSSFWAPILLELPEELQNVAIQRSCNHPLDVHYSSLRFGGQGRGRGRGSNDNSRRVRSDRILSRAMVERWPIKSLNVRAPLYIQDNAPLYTLLTSPAPILKTVELNTRGPLNNIFGGSAPLLRRAILESLELGPNMEALSCLRILRLRLRRVGSMSITQLMGLLSRSPELEELSMKRQEFNPPSLAFEISSPGLALNRLRSLEFANMPSGFTTAIIGHLILPTTANLSLRVTGEITHQLANPDFADLLAVVTKQRPPSCIRVIFWYGRYLRVEGNGWSAKAPLVGHIWIDLVEPAVDSDYFLMTIPVPIRNSVSVFDFAGQENVNPILQALDTTFPDLHEFRFELTQYDEEFSLSALAQSGSDRTRFRCPALRRLTMVQPIWDPVFLEAVAQVAERRRDPKSPKLIPSPIESFTWEVGQVVSTSPTALDLLERIRRVVPQVTVREHKSPTRQWSRTARWDSGMRSDEEED